MFHHPPVCLYEVNFKVLRSVTTVDDVTSVKDVDNWPRRHIGSLSLQRKTASKWNTSASLVLNHVDENCSLVSTEKFWNHNDSEKAVTQVSTVNNLK